MTNENQQKRNLKDKVKNGFEKTLDYFPGVGFKRDFQRSMCNPSFLDDRVKDIGSIVINATTTALVIASLPSLIYNESNQREQYEQDMLSVFGPEGVADSNRNGFVEDYEKLKAYEDMGITIGYYVDGNEVIIEPERKPTRSELTDYIQKHSGDLSNTYTTKPEKETSYDNTTTGGRE